MGGPVSDQRGYSLLLAAVVVAVLALVLLTVARVQGGLQPGVRALRTEMRQDVVAESLFARVSFLLLTEPVGPRSLVIGGPRELGAAAAAGRGQELRLDGRRYAVGEDSFISI